MNVNKSIIILMSILCAWGIFGLIISFTQFSDDSAFIRKYPIPVSKEYFASFETSYVSDEHGLKAEKLTGQFSIDGNITLKSSMFSADNPIDVRIELSPDIKKDPEYAKLLNALPNNYWGFFLNAHNYENGKIIDRNIAIINLTKSKTEPKIIGDGTIVYMYGGNHEIYIVDPRELQKIPQKIIDRIGDYEFVYSFPKPSLSGVPVRINSSGVITEAAGLSIPQSNLVPYYVEITSSDALLSLENNKQGKFAIWLAITIAPITISIGLRQPILRFLDKLTKEG